MKNFFVIDLQSLFQSDIENLKAFSTAIGYSLIYIVFGKINKFFLFSEWKNKIRYSK